MYKRYAKRTIIISEEKLHLTVGLFSWEQGQEYSLKPVRPLILFGRANRFQDIIRTMRISEPFWLESWPR